MVNEIQGAGNYQAQRTQYQNNWADNLNRGSDVVLDKLASFGSLYDRGFSGIGQNRVDNLSSANKVLGSLAAAKVGIDYSEAHGVARQLKQSSSYFKRFDTQRVIKVVQKFQSPKYAQGALGKITAYGARAAGNLAGGFGAITGVGEALSSLNVDRASKTGKYYNTMRSTAQAVAQSSFGYAAGSFAAGVATSIVGVGLAPLAIGFGVGIAGAWAVNKLFQ